MTASNPTATASPLASVGSAVLSMSLCVAILLVGSGKRLIRQPIVNLGRSVIRPIRTARPSQRYQS
jgi:hypothetical protein